ncbi:MAG: HAD-IA family hydrolase [Planctomycetes bacterium]|nr:HAD-IA family hydrolase [Planctomycetota bacterium]
MTLPPPFLFDLDGTLADTLPDIAASANHVRVAHGLSPAPAEVARSWLGDGARALLSRALAEVLPAAGPPREAALDAAFASYVDHHRAQCTVHARLFPGVLDHLATLRERGHALAIVTNKPARFARPVVAHLGLDRLCAVLVGGDTLPVRKPDPAPLRHALQQLGSGGDGATMVGDGLQDLRAAKLLGLCTIACLFGYGDPAKLRAEGADAYWRAFGVPA